MMVRVLVVVVVWLVGGEGVVVSCIFVGGGGVGDGSGDVGEGDGGSYGVIDWK